MSDTPAHHDVSVPEEAPRPSAADHALAARCVQYRAMVESAAAAGGIDRLRPGQARFLAQCEEELGIDRATVLADVDAWRGRLAAVRLVEEAAGVRDGFRSVSDLDALLETAKAQLARVLLDLTADIGALVRERLARQDAEKAVAAADRRASTPAGMSWAFHGFDRPAPTRPRSNLNMNAEAI